MEDIFTFLSKVFHLLLFIAILFAITELYNQLLRNQRRRFFHTFLRFLHFNYNTEKVILKMIIPLKLTLQIHITASIYLYPTNSYYCIYLFVPSSSLSSKSVGLSDPSESESSKALRSFSSFPSFSSISFAFFLFSSISFLFSC